MIVHRLQTQVRCSALLRNARATISSIQYSKRGSTTSKQASVANPVNFSNIGDIYKDCSTSELIRAFVVYSGCATPSLIDNGEKLLKLCYSILGKTMGDFVMEKTFYGHFVGGKSITDTFDRVASLHEKNIGSILDHAAESDIGLDDGTADTIRLANTAAFIECVHGARDHHNDPNYSPIIGIKFSAMISTKTLISMTNAINEWTRLYDVLSAESGSTATSSGNIPKAVFLTSFSSIFHIDALEADSAYNAMDVSGRGFVDKSDWSIALPMSQVSLYLSKCTLARIQLPSTVLDQIAIMFTRLESICNAARDKSPQVSIMMDAEQTYFQPAIHYAVVHLSRRFNTPGGIPLVYDTHQMYLKDSFQRLLDDMSRAKRWNYHFAIKTVRGAYIHGEKAYADLHNKEYPIWPTIEGTHDNYNKAVAEILTRISALDGSDRISLMVASHNAESVAAATQLMHDLQIPSDKVIFGQLLGMCDYITYSLAKSGHRVFKWIPYEEIRKILAYLLRRAQENRGALHRVTFERNLVFAELRKRIWWL